MRVLAVLALVALFALLSVEARALHRVTRALVAGESKVMAGPIPYGFQCTAADTCANGAKCLKDSMAPMATEKINTGMVCLFEGEGDAEPTAAPTSPVAVQAKSACVVPAKRVLSMGGCDCDAQCNDGFVCGAPKKAGGQNVCRPPAPLAKNDAAPIIDGPIPCGPGAATENCATGVCMSKTAYACKLSQGKDVASCSSMKPQTKFFCRSVATPAAPPAITPAKNCSNKGEYTFWNGPGANAHDVKSDPSAVGFLADGTTAFYPCCAATTIATPEKGLKGQYGFIVGQIGKC